MARVKRLKGQRDDAGDIATEKQSFSFPAIDESNSADSRLTSMVID